MAASLAASADASATTPEGVSDAGGAAAESAAATTNGIAEGDLGDAAADNGDDRSTLKPSDPTPDEGASTAAAGADKSQANGERNPSKSDTGYFSNENLLDNSLDKVGRQRAWVLYLHPCQSDAGDGNLMSDGVLILSTFKM